MIETPALRRLLYFSIAAMAQVGLGLTVRTLTQRAAVAASQITPTLVPTPTLTVTFTAPRRAVWPMTLEPSGEIAPWQEASVGAQIGGYQLTDVYANVGDQVSKGQILARFDPALLQADESVLKASDDQAEANQERALHLRSTGATSDKDALQYVTQAKTAAALLASKRLQLRYIEVLAPDEGVISSRTATLGAVVPIGQELFRFIRQNRLEWRGEFTAVQLAHIEIGQPVELTLPGGGGVNATIRKTAPSLDPRSRLGIIYADVVPDSRARAGMYVDGRVVIGQSEALVVPAESATIRDGRSCVLKLMDASATPRVSLRPLTVGRRRGNHLEIVDGVGRDDRLVVAGTGFLNEGDLVRVEEINDRSAQSP